MKTTMMSAALCLTAILSCGGAHALPMTHDQIVARAWQEADKRSSFYRGFELVKGPIPPGLVERLIREMERENSASAAPQRASKRYAR
jgi:hypothetical protein